MRAALFPAKVLPAIWQQAAGNPILIVDVNLGPPVSGRRISRTVTNHRLSLAYAAHNHRTLRDAVLNKLPRDRLGPGTRDPHCGITKALATGRRPIAGRMPDDPDLPAGFPMEPRDLADRRNIFGRKA